MSMAGTFSRSVPTIDPQDSATWPRPGGHLFSQRGDPGTARVVSPFCSCAPFGDIPQAAGVCRGQGLPPRTCPPVRSLCRARLRPNFPGTSTGLQTYPPPPPPPFMAPPPPHPQALRIVRCPVTQTARSPGGRAPHTPAGLEGPKASEWGFANRTSADATSHLFLGGGIIRTSLTASLGHRPPPRVLGRALR